MTSLTTITGTPPPADGNTQTLSQRLLAQCRGTTAAVNRLGDVLGSIEERPDQAEAFRLFYARITALRGEAEAMERQARRMARVTTAQDAGL